MKTSIDNRGKVVLIPDGVGDEIGSDDLAFVKIDGLEINRILSRDFADQSSHFSDASNLEGREGAVIFNINNQPTSLFWSTDKQKKNSK